MNTGLPLISSTRMEIPSDRRCGSCARSQSPSESDLLDQSLQRRCIVRRFDVCAVASTHCVCSRSQTANGPGLNGLFYLIWGGFSISNCSFGTRHFPFRPLEEYVLFANSCILQMPAFCWSISGITWFSRINTSFISKGLTSCPDKIGGIMCV